MIEEELKSIWKNSSNTEKIKFDLSRLMIDLNTTMKTVERAIRRRDRREIGASVIGIVVHAGLAVAIPFLITKLACILAIFWFIYVIIKLKGVQKRKARVDLSESFRDQIRSQKNHMLDQKNLLDTILYWYVLPPFIVNIIFFIGLGDPADYEWSNAVAAELLPMTVMDKVRVLCIVAVFYSGVVWMNKRAVKKTVKPILRDIEKVEQQLESEY